MIQFLNNIWVALSSENVELVNLLLMPTSIVENYLIMQIFLITFNINCSKKHKFLYVVLVTISSILSLNYIPSPFNIFINYSIIILLIKFIFNLNLLKSFLSLILPTAVFGLLAILIQNPYIRLLNISFNTFMYTPIYRFSYIIIVYIIIFVLCILFKKYRNIKISLDFLDTLNKKTKQLLFIDLCIGFMALCLQVITTAFYMDLVPIIISILNFILLLSFIVLSIYSFTHIIKLANTRKELASAEEYNKSLQNLYDEVKGFKHDFDNIVSTIDGYIETNDMNGLKQYFRGVKKDCKLTNNLSLLNPSSINNPGLYSLLNNKYFKAINLGITFDIEFFFNLDSLDVNIYEFSRILGVLIDNAIEEAEKCKKKIIKMSFIRENNNHRSLITIANTYSNKNVDLEKIFEKGESGKSNHSGIGLWEVRKYVRKSKNLDLFTSKTDEFFKQELSIYDIVKK